MKKTNFQSLFPHYRLNKTNIYEKLLILGFSFGVFMSYDIIDNARYVILLIVELLLFVKMCKSVKAVREFLFVFLITLLITIIFVFLSSQPILLINRVLPMLSVFGIVIVGKAKKHVNIEIVIKGFLNFYLYLAAYVNIDYVMFLFNKTSIWEPISYIGVRACGPQGDPNFLALYSCVALLLLLHLNTNRFLKITGSIIFLLNIVFANSLAAIIILVFAILFNGFLSNNNCYKNIIILCVYFSIIFLYGTYSDVFENIGTWLLSILYKGDSKYVTAKYLSLDYRLLHQYQALQIFLKEWWGQGPRQVVMQLGLDTHNSYVGFMFEQGIFGIILIIVTLKNNVKNNFNRYISLFIMLLALVLNVHMTGVYSLFLLSQYYIDDNRRKTWGGYHEKHFIHFR